MSDICPICNKEIKEFDIFWLMRVEKINKLLEREIKEIKICAKHELEGIQSLANKIHRK